MRSPSVVVVVSASVAFLACSSSQQTGSARTSSAQLTAAGSPDLRTVDNAGFVGPAGNTRSVSQGAGPTTVGRGEMVPPPRRENPAGGEAAAEGTPGGPPVTPITTSPSDPAEAIARAARAYCDRETFCEHVGPNRAYGSGDSCVADTRERLQRSAQVRACPDTISGERLGACLTAIRATPCAPRGQAAPPPPECSPSALCA
jgi:hypothetical protein